MLISLCLTSMYKIQKNFEVTMSQRGLINMQTNELVAIFRRIANTFMK